MATKKRNYKHEYQLQKERGDVEGFLERQKARRLVTRQRISKMPLSLVTRLVSKKEGTFKIASFYTHRPHIHTFIIER